MALQDAARVTGAALVGGAPGAGADGVSIDSRRVQVGDLFVALPGAVTDGHLHVEEALAAGAAAALVARPVVGRDGAVLAPLLVADDPAAALRALAAWVRDATDPVVVGVTGSTGKTSTKDLIAAVAAAKFRTVAAERSHNNELGVPLTLLAATPETDVVICELGARGPGQIRQLCEYVRPQIGVVTTVGVTHYEQFGSVDAIAAAKAELPAALPEDGVAVLNADDPRVAAMAEVTRAEVLTYGTAPGAWLRAESIDLDELGRATFTMTRGVDRRPVTLGTSGRHQVHNALAAGAVGLVLGLSLDQVAAGLAAARMSPWRMEVEERSGVVVVNDAYNANPTSMAAALEACAAMVQPGGRLLAVLGYMAELGVIEEAEHERVGALAAVGVQRLVVVGEGARPIARGAAAAGLTEVVVVDAGAGPAAAVEALGELRPGDVVLVKASRVAGLERAASLVARPPVRATQP